MTTYSFPNVYPKDAVFGYESVTMQHRSWLTGLRQTMGFGGEHWTYTLMFKVSAANRNELTGWLAQLNGMEHRATLPVYKLAQRGAFGGTPVVNGASQSGTQLTVSGCSNNITNWIRRGDWFTVNSELKMCTEDANSDGSGNVTIKFRPRLRTSPSNGASIETTAPTGKFMLATPSVQWSVNAWDETSETSLEFVEAVL